MLLCVRAAGVKAQRFVIMSQSIWIGFENYWIKAPAEYPHHPRFKTRPGENVTPPQLPQTKLKSNKYINIGLYFVLYSWEQICRWLHLSGSSSQNAAVGVVLMCLRCASSLWEKSSCEPNSSKLGKSDLILQLQVLLAESFFSLKVCVTYKCAERTNTVSPEGQSDLKMIQQPVCLCQKLHLLVCYHGGECLLSA